MTASQLIGVLTAVATGGDASAAAAVAINATEYNYLKHREMAQLNQELAGCEGRGDCDSVAAKFFEKHIANKETLEKVCQVSKQGCMDAAVEIYEAVYGFQAGEYTEELDKRGREILAAFHSFNLDARTDAAGGIIAPTAESFMASLGLDPNDPIVRAAARGLASIVAGKASGKGANGGAKVPKTVDEISNPPQAPIIPSDWVSRPGRNGGEIYFPVGTDPAKGEHIRVMPPGSSPVPGYEDGYWRWQNSSKQPMNPATGKPGIGQGDTHVPLPPDSVPPVRR